MVLKDVSDDVGVQADSPAGTSDHSAVFIDVFLEQPHPYLVHRQEVYLKNSSDWDHLIEDEKGLNWNEIFRSPCPVSLLNEALLCVIKDRIPKRTIGVRTRVKPWFDDRCDLTHPAK